MQRRTENDKINCKLQHLKMFYNNNFQHDVRQLNDYNYVQRDIIDTKMVQSSYYGDYDDYIYENRETIHAEVALWRAALWQEIADATSESNKFENQKAKRDAINFFSSDISRKHLVALCNLCGYNYKHIIKYIGEKRDKLDLQKKRATQLIAFPDKFCAKIKKNRRGVKDNKNDKYEK